MAGVCVEAQTSIPMTAPSLFRLSRLSRKTWILLALTLGVMTLVLLFDWNWLRGPLVRHLATSSGREVRIDRIDVDLGLEPVVRLRGIYVANALWASPRPLISAGEMAFKVSLASLWRRRPVISRLVLVDASVDLERSKDGLRNWRLRDPEDRQPGRVVVTTLEAHRSELRFVNHALDLDFVATTSPAKVQSARSGADDLPTHIAFEGRYQGRAFVGEALSSGVISFRASGLSVPLRGHIAAGSTRLYFDGRFTDLFDIAHIDARVRLSGPSLALLHPFLRIRPPPSRPYAIEALLTETKDVYRFSQLTGKIGGTPLTGEVVYDRSGARPRLEARLHSEAADFADVRPLFGMPSENRGVRGEVSRAADQASPGNKQDLASGKEKPDASRPSRRGGLRTADIHLTSSLKKLAVGQFRMLEDVRLEVRVQQGLLELNPFTAQIAGGKVTGTLTFDARKDAAAGSLSGELRGARLERLLPKLAAKSASAGALHAQMKLSGGGDTLAEMLGSAVGSFTATLDRGRISNLADAKLGLNYGKVISVFVRGDREIAINCAAAAFDVRKGMAQSRRIVLDTAETHVEGTGSISLRVQELDLLLTPEPKNPGLFTRRASVRIRGPVKQPAISIEERAERASGPQGDC